MLPCRKEMLGIYAWGGIQNDIHEKNIDFMRKVYDNALFVANYLNFTIIDCVKDGSFKSIEEIHKEIIDKIN